ncbi:PD-(D/E)XK nuclease family protein [Streptosporangium sp. NPDC000239]|uniref:PD-(D/E)XK nuclease family protein n=1 Tax=Streptosporangium sp. NPDC000239 TaxID=3154248 RepID=UPI00332D450B
MSQRTSVSRLTSIARCGTAYELERVERLPSLPAGWTIQGIAIHAAADAWEKSRRTMKLLNAQEVFKRSWRAEIDKADQRFPERDRWLVGGRKKVQNDLLDRYSDGMRQVTDYIDYNLTNPNLVPYTMPDGSPAAEVGFEIDFRGITVRGYIDIIMQDTRTGELLVRDIKSGSKAPVVPFQLIVYRKAVAEVLGEEARWGDFFMTRQAKPTQPLDLTTLDEALVEEWFVRQAAIEQQGLFIPNPGDACRTCSVSIHCPLMN